MAPIPSTLMFSRSKKKEPRYIYLSEARASHSHKMWTEVSSSVPHFLQVWLLLSPIKYRCLLKVLCPVSRPITTLDCVLLDDSNRAPVARLGPEIKSRAYLCVLHGPHHNARCCFSIQSFIFFLISSWSKKKEPKYECLSEARVSHSHKMWTEVSSSVPHFLQMGLSLSPITYKCLLKVLCPVSRAITTLDCVLLTL
jgi:hypothetical protein